MQPYDPSRERPSMAVGVGIVDMESVLPRRWLDRAQTPARVAVLAGSSSWGSSAEANNIFVRRGKSNGRSDDDRRGCRLDLLLRSFKSTAIAMGTFRPRRPQPRPTRGAWTAAKHGRAEFCALWPVRPVTFRPTSHHGWSPSFSAIPSCTFKCAISAATEDPIPSSGISAACLYGASTSSINP